MSGSFGQTVLTIVGTFVGAAFGNPLLGLTLGNSIGGALFNKPPTQYGPRLGDRPTTDSEVGVFVPICFGTVVVSGTVLYANPTIREVSTSRRVSKGGPKQVTYSYYQTIAIGLCEGPITAVRRVWENGKCVYDVRPQQDGEADADYSARVAQSEQYSQTFTLYTGTNVQAADPQIESEAGAGAVPGYRGLAYLVYPDRMLQDEQGLRHPDFKVEVVAAGSLVETTQTEYANEVMLDWPVNSTLGTDPRNALQTYEYRGYDAQTDTYSIVSASLDGARNSSLNSSGNPLGLLDTLIGWGKEGSVPIGSGLYPYCGPGSYQPTYEADDIFDRTRHAYFNRYSFGGVNNGQIDATPGGGDAWLSGTVGVGNYWTGNGNSSDPEQRYTHGVVYATGAPLPASQYAVRGTYAVEIRRIPMPPLDVSVGKLPAPVAGYYIDPDTGEYVKQTPWELVSGTFRVLDIASAGGSGLVYDRLPLDPVLPSTDPNYSNSAWWATYYADAVAEGRMTAGGTFGSQYGVVQNWAYRRTLTTLTAIAYEVSLASIVTALANRVGLTTLDVSDLEEIMVAGFKIETRVACRGAIESLRPVGHFDIVASGDTVRFPVRGGALVKTFTAAELAARGSGETRPPAVAMRDQDPSELARRLHVRYMSLARDHEPSQQKSPARLESGTVSEPTLEVPVVISDDQAAQIAEVLLAEQWTGRRSFTFATSVRNIGLEPADPVGLPVDGRTIRALIKTIEFARPGTLQIEAVRDLAEQYTSTATGSAPESVPINDMPILGTPLLTLLDLPYLGASDPRDPSGNASVLVLVRSVGGNAFNGALIEQTLDSGATYEDLAAVDIRPAYGTLTAALPSGPTTIFDDGNELLVDLHSGELSSRDLAAVLAGANLCAVGAPGRWEILQFTTAVKTSATEWKLTGLLRGRRGTEWAVGSSEEGDQFVLLSPVGAVPVLELDTSRIGWTLSLRTTLVGTLTSSGEISAFTPAGVILKPFAPAALAASGSLGDGGWMVSWSRRDRVAIEFPQSGTFVMSEASERYEVDLLDADGTVLATVSTTTEAAHISELALVGGAGSGVAQENILTVPVKFIAWDAGLSQYIGVYSIGSGNASLRRYDSSLEYVNGQGFGNAGTAYAAYGVAILGSHVYVAVVNQSGGSDGRVLKYATADFSFVADYAGTAAGDCQDVASDGTDLWVPEPITGVIRKIDPATMTSSASVPFICNKLAATSTAVWAAYGGVLKEIDPATASVVNTYAYTDTSVVVRMVATATRVAIRTAAGLTIIDAATGTTLAEHTMVVAGSGTYGVELAYDGSSFIAYNYTAQSLVFIDPATGAIQRTQVFPQALESYTGVSIYMPAVGGTLAGVANGRYFITRSPTGATFAPAATTYVFQSLASGGGSGAGAPYRARVYQISQAVGRGYPAEIELP